MAWAVGHPRRPWGPPRRRRRALRRTFPDAQIPVRGPVCDRAIRGHTSSRTSWRAVQRARGPPATRAAEPFDPKASFTNREKTRSPPSMSGRSHSASGHRVGLGTCKRCSGSHRHSPLCPSHQGLWRRATGAGPKRSARERSPLSSRRRRPPPSSRVRDAPLCPRYDESGVDKSHTWRRKCVLVPRRRSAPAANGASKTRRRWSRRRSIQTSRGLRWPNQPRDIFPRPTRSGTALLCWAPFPCARTA